MLKTLNLHKIKKTLVVALIVFVAIFVAITFFAIVSNQNESHQTATNELSKTLPYITKEYSIIYSKEKGQYYINLLKPPYEANRQKALDWIISQDVDPRTLNISYTPRSVNPTSPKTSP